MKGARGPILALLLLLPAPSRAVPADAAPPPSAPSSGLEFPLHRIRIWGSVGAAVSSGPSALSLGAGVGYLLDGGFMPSIALGFAVGNGVRIVQARPGIDWFLPVPLRIAPFVGAYWSHWFVSDAWPQQDAWGVRAGFSLASFGPASLLVGVAYERPFGSCTGPCGYWVPQIGAGFGL